MPEGATEFVQELDLDEQVQQLVESIETTTRDITARATENFGEDPLMTPEAVASLATPKDTPEESTPTETTEPGEDSGDASDSDPVEEAASDPPEDADLESEVEAVVEAEADTVDDVDVVDEVETETEPTDGIEAVEEAIEQIDEAVDRLVENAVDSVDAAEPDSAVESADQPISDADADADAVEQEQIENPAIEAPVSAEDNAEDNAEPVAEPAENAEGESADDDAESATAPDDKFAVEGDFNSVGEADTADQPESDAGNNEKKEQPIDEFDSVTSTVTAEAESPETAPIADSSPKPVSASAPTEAKVSVGSGIRIPAFVGSLVGDLVPIAAKAVLAINAPVRRLGPTARQSVGWIAINTAFLALCVLIIALLRTTR